VRARTLMRSLVSRYQSQLCLFVSQFRQTTITCPAPLFSAVSTLSWRPSAVSHLPRSVERPCWLANCIFLLGHASEQQSREAVSCLLQVLAASERQLPPCDLSSILTPLCRSSEWPHGSLAYALFYLDSQHVHTKH